MNKQFVLNYASSILLLLVRTVYGFVLPRLIILSYGSEINGAASLASQVVSCLQLIEMGIYGAALVSLYGPMASGDKEKIDSAMTLLNRMFHRIGWIFSVATSLVALVMPFVVRGGVDQATIFGLIITIALANVINYFVSGKYRALLQADNRLYVVRLVNSLGFAIQTALSLLAIQYLLPIVAVKASLVVSGIVEAAVLLLYVKHRYGSINYKAHGHSDILQVRQRDIMIHQIATLIMMNTDIIVLSIVSGLDAASVYSVYNMIAIVVMGLADSLPDSVSARLGQLFAVGKPEDTARAYLRFERVYIPAVFLLYGCMAILTTPFMEVYTAGISDINYVLPGLAIWFSLAGLTRALQKPAHTAMAAKGGYRQTASILIAQTAIKIVGSLSVFVLGIPGLLLATCAANVFGCIAFRVYAQKIIPCLRQRQTVSCFVKSLACCGVFWLISSSVILPNFTFNSYFAWIGCAVLVFAIGAVLEFFDIGIRYLIEQSKR